MVIIFWLKSIFTTAPAAPKSNACLKNWQNWLKIFISLYYSIILETLCIFFKSALFQQPNKQDYFLSKINIILSWKFLISLMGQLKRSFLFLFWKKIHLHDLSSGCDPSVENHWSKSLLNLNVTSEIGRNLCKNLLHQNFGGKWEWKRCIRHALVENLFFCWKCIFCSKKLIKNN